MFRNPCISHHPARRDPASSTRPIRTNPPSLSAALPLNLGHASTTEYQRSEFIDQSILAASDRRWQDRSEEHTSELQSPCNLVCRLLLEKKKHKNIRSTLGHRGFRPHPHTRE